MVVTGLYTFSSRKAASPGSQGVPVSQSSLWTLRTCRVPCGHSRETFGKSQGLQT